MLNTCDTVIRIVIALGLLSQAGCASTATPDFWVKRVEGPDKNGSYKFELQKTLLRIEKDDSNSSPVARNIPAEKGGETFKFDLKDTPGQITKLEVAYVPNTRLIYSIGTQVTDYKRQAVEAVGGVIGQIIKLVPAFKAEKQTVYPFVIDVSDYLARYPNGELACLPGRDNTGLCSRDPNDAVNVYSIRLSEDKPDWVPNAEAGGLGKSVLPYAACRDATLEIRSRENGIGIVVREYLIRVADPRFVETIQIPAQGTLTMHAECGFSIGNIGVLNKSDADTVSAVLEQINALKDEINKMNEQPTP